MPFSRPGICPVVLVSMCMLQGVAMGGGMAVTENFRLENKVFVGSGKKPIVESTTIFHEGVVYDYMEDPAEVVIFEKDHGRFTILDTDRRVRTDMTTEQVTTFTEKLKQTAAAQKDPFARFLADPKFDEQFNEASSQLTLSSPWMTYRMELVEAGSRSISRQYREFSDWYARLNSLLSPHSRPPFARLLVNAALAKHRATAREVHLTMTPKRTFPPKRVKLRSEHQFVRGVGGADLDRLAQTRQFMEIFKPLSFEQYRKAED